MISTHGNSLLLSATCNRVAGTLEEQVLTKGCDSKDWIRDPESSIPLEIVKDAQGRIYVRAQVRHFSRWSFWEKDLDAGDQMYATESISWSNRRRHQSLIKNCTDDDVTIYAFAMRMARWDVAFESFKAGAGAGDAQGTLEVVGSMHKKITAAALLPQMVAIPSGNSHWFEIPRVGTTSSRKAVVAIVTESNDEKDGQRLR